MASKVRHIAREPDASTRPSTRDARDARDGRAVALVIAVAGLVWVGLNWAGRRLGWDQSYALLFDFAALAAFFWALVATWRIWRRQPSKRG